MEAESSFINCIEELQKLKIKNNDNKNISSEEIPKNFSESSFFEKFFYLWAKPALNLANKRPLENKDVCNVAPEQKTINILGEFQRIFIEKSKIKKNKYPLFFSILSLHYKYFLYIYFLFVIDLSIVYTKIYFFKRIISIFSRGDFYPERNFNIWKITEFKFNIVESIIFFIFF